MSSITISAPVKPHPNLRPLSIFRDLPPVADLIEQCFSSTMDNDGRRYIQDMRRAGGDHGFLQWANRVADSTSLPLTGFVWEEDHRIIGNVSLVPFRRNKHRLYLIANVAVHPEHRRRGIARALTLHAMQHAREKNIDDLWLHVRADNFDAIPLYQSLGFVERARRTQWQAVTSQHLDMPQTDIAVEGRHPRYWAVQSHWLSRLYPDHLGWHANWNLSMLRPGFLTWLKNMFMDMNVRQWAAVRRNNLLATLSWIPTGRGESLFAATGARSDPEALTLLLVHARRELHYSHPRIQLDFPTGPFDNAIEAAGFKIHRTLLWMQATSA
ncbi:MAG: GNAT family N-acetyltransferase [Anaerolineales bacterium]|nr:GNAT family N-acetyltransferase [Anaerolineales bacterium]